MTFRGLGNGYRLLIVLHREGGNLQGGELRKAIKNYDTAKNVANDLCEVGLVKVERVKRPKLTHIYSLTPKGNEVAELLLKVDDMIWEGIERPEEE